MIKLLTTAVQSLPEPKTETKSVNRQKKTESSPFGECLKSVESSQNMPEESEKLSKEKSDKDCAQVYAAVSSTPPVIISMISTAPVSDVTLSSAPMSDNGSNEVKPLEANVTQEIKTSNIAVNIGETETPVNSARPGEALAENISIPSSGKTEKAVAEKTEATGKSEKAVKTEAAVSTKNDILPIPEMRIETAKNDKEVSPKNPVSSEPLQASNDLKSKEVLPQAQSVKENISETAYENSVQVDAKTQKSIENKVIKSDRSIEPKVDEGKAISISEKSSPDKTAAADVKPLQSKTSDKPSGEKAESFSVPEKEALPKKAADTVKTGVSEAILTGVYSGKEIEKNTGVSGENITAQITRALKEIKRPDNTRLTVELAPKELGKITVEMKYSEGKLNLLMSAESKETAKVLSEQIGQLKTALAANKVEIQTLDVSSNPHIDLAFSNMNNSGGKFSGEDKGAFQNRFASNYMDLEDKTKSEKPLTYSMQNQLLNYLA